MHIALLTDTTSREYEISEKSLVLIQDSLEKLGYAYTIIRRPEMRDQFLQTYTTYDCAIPVIHGGWGEGGQISAMLELLGVPYLFSDHDVHSLCYNKYATSLIVQDMGIAIPQTHHCVAGDDMQHISFGGPYFVKPNTNGSSLDCGICTTADQAQGLVEHICTYDTALVQEVITGRELTISMKGTDSPSIVGIMEVVTEKEFFDFDAKYKRDKTKEIFPELAPNLQQIIEDAAMSIYKKFRITDIARIDCILADKLYFLEINTIPGMTPMSFFPQCIKQYGYEGFEQFLEECIQQKVYIYKKIKKTTPTLIKHMNKQSTIV